MKNLRLIFSFLDSHEYQDPLKFRFPKGHMLFPSYWGMAYARDIPGKGRYYVDARGKHIVKI